MVRVLLLVDLISNTQKYTNMKKTIYSLIGIGLMTCAHGASGIFGTGTALTHNGTSTFYQTTLLGDGRHVPVGSSPTQNSTGLGGLGLGTFDTSIGNTLVLNGGGVLTFKNSGDNISASRIIYSIDGGSEATINLGFNDDDAGDGADGDQRWYGEGSSVDVLAGLANGGHTLAVRYESDFTFTGGGGGSGTYNENAGGSNFTATFTTVPEPSSTALLGLGGLALILRRRK